MRPAKQAFAGGSPRPHFEPILSRRDMLLRCGNGFGALALAAMLGGERPAGADEAGDPAAQHRGPHHQATATSAIFLFMEGGPSHIDLFDPKPELEKLAGKPLPPSFKRVITAMGEMESPVLPSKRKWKQHGQSGLWVSDWLPHTAECIDDIAVLRSCWGEGINHAGGMSLMNTCSILGGRPSLGAWATYGLGTENENLPAFVVMEDHRGQTVGGVRNWGTGFMPAEHQGVALDSGPIPIPNLGTPKGIGTERQRAKLDLLEAINRQHAALRTGHRELEARIESYELAFRMQAAAPEAVDLAGETEETRSLYGLDDKETAVFGRNCLLARRLVERGVRFVQLFHGAGSKWDAHKDIEGNHGKMCRQSDKPIAGLLQDLKRRGLLERTLVVWGGEFGRTPMSEQGNGRDHNPTGFTMWMAGGGIRGGQVIGTTDEVGLHAVEDRLHVRDVHATILHALGLNNLQLTYLHSGRPERPTINEGRPCLKLFG